VRADISKTAGDEHALVSVVIAATTNLGLGFSSGHIECFFCWSMSLLVKM